MDPKIPASFWSRRDLESEPSEVLLATFWLYTNPRVSLVGFGEISERTFIFETRLRPDALGRACRALGKGLVRSSNDYWLRDAIANNFGRGTSLAASHMAIALLKDAEGLGRPWVRQEITKEYPELAERWYREREKGLGKGFVSPTQGPEQNRAEQSRAEQSRGEDRGAGGRGTGKKSEGTGAAGHFDPKQSNAHTAGAKEVR